MESDIKKLLEPHKKSSSHSNLKSLISPKTVS